MYGGYNKYWHVPLSSNEILLIFYRVFLSEFTLDFHNIQFLRRYKNLTKSYEI